MSKIISIDCPSGYVVTGGQVSSNTIEATNGVNIDFIICSNINNRNNKLKVNAERQITLIDNQVKTWTMSPCEFGYSEISNSFITPQYNKNGMSTVCLENTLIDEDIRNPNIGFSTFFPEYFSYRVEKIIDTCPEGQSISGIVVNVGVRGPDPTPRILSYAGTIGKCVSI